MLDINFNSVKTVWVMCSRFTSHLISSHFFIYFIYLASTANLESPVKLTCMSVDCRKRPEYLEMEAQGERARKGPGQTLLL